ncbi:MAG: hypothetical protein IPM97_12475 [Bdellovibrionaceae bacterium]|nr:hypothetical protein [Pseudobdellovibrionaceae bacterium]
MKLFLLMTLLAFQNSWALDIKRQNDDCDKIMMKSGRPGVTDTERSRYESTPEGDIHRLLETTRLNGKCVPIKYNVKRPGEDMEVRWSLEDCYEIEKGITLDEIRKCRVTESKIKTLLQRDFSGVATDYGYPTSGISPIEIAAVIRDRCKAEPVIKGLLKDPDVIQYFTLKNTSPKIQKNRPPSAVR